MSIFNCDNILWQGGVTFTYSLQDADGNTCGGSVTINPVDEAPTAGDDAATVTAGGTVSIPVLANDTDPEGEALSITEATATAGTVTVGADGTLSYTAPADFSGTATVTYTIVDPAGNADQGTVTITVSPPDDLAPVAGDDTATVTAGGTVSIPVLANDTDPEGRPLTVTGATATTGTVAVEANGTLRYTAPAGYAGTVTVGYTIEDSAGNGADGTVTVTVIPSIVISGTNAVGDITVDAASGAVTVTVYEPADYADEYLLTTSDLRSGPVNLALPRVTGGTAPGDTLTALPGIWAYDEAHGPIAFGQQWYRGDTPIAVATGDTYVIADGDAATGVRFVRTATNTAGTRSVEIDAVAPTPPPGFVEAGVRFNGTAKLVRDADLGMDTGAVFFFVDLIPHTVGRNGILRQTSLGNGVEFWNGQFRFYMGSTASSRALVAGQRARFVAAGWFDGTSTHRAVWSRLGDEPGWTLDADNVAPGAALFDLTLGGFTIGARHSGMTPDVTQGLDATIHRIVLWSGSIPDTTLAATFNDFVAADGSLVDPAVSRGRYGTPHVDIFGKATDYMAAINHGTAGNFDLVQGTLTDA